MTGDAAMPKVTHFNHRSAEGVPGGTDFTQMTDDQGLLQSYLCGATQDTLVCMVLNHTTLEEQAEFIRVYRMCDREARR
jgi:hypothetical protein